MRKISLNWDVQLDKILGKVGDINKKNTKTKPNKKTARAKLSTPEITQLLLAFTVCFLVLCNCVFQYFHKLKSQAVGIWMLT